MHIHYVVQVGSSVLAQGFCWASKVICACTAVSEGLWWLFEEEDPYLFCPLMVAHHLRTPEVLLFLPAPCFTVSQPWSSKFVTIRCSLSWNTGCYSTIQRLSTTLCSVSEERYCFA